MSAQELDSTIKIKCRLLKLLPCSILVLSRVISYQMITKWTFLKYTQEGLFKNVQDGISRRLGSRKNSKNKSFGGNSV